MDNLINLVNGRIEDLTQIMEQAELDGDWSTYDYCSGAIDAYDIVRINIVK